MTLFFEIDPDDIGRSGFGERVSRNLRAIINIAEGDTVLSYSKEYEPDIWSVIFS